jgi:hypothetical protein
LIKVNVVNRSFPSQKYIKPRSQYRRLSAVVGALGYSLGMVLPALAQVDIRLLNQGNATYQTGEQQLETITNTIESNYRVEAIAGIRINFDRVSNAKTGLTLGPIATSADSPLSFYFTVVNTLVD